MRVQSFVAVTRPGDLIFHDLGLTFPTKVTEKMGHQVGENPAARYLRKIEGAGAFKHTPARCGLIFQER